jgi:hypothetical protein
MAAGCLAALGRLQGQRRNDFRDEQSGKIPHELRHDELTRLGVLLYSPYYGTHDAPALYCLALWNAWRWSGDRALLDVPLLIAQLFLGIVPDAPHGRCFISPWLPEWLPRLEVSGIAIGDSRLDVAIARDGNETVIVRAEAGDMQLIKGSVDAPLWGVPPAMRGTSRTV